jgi:aspartate racemase
MELPFWRTRLAERFGVELVTPERPAREMVHRVIYGELCLGRIESSSRRAYAAVIDQLRDAGAEALVLGCTEIGLLIGQSDSSLRIFDTSTLHAAAGVDYSLRGREARQLDQALQL